MKKTKMSQVEKEVQAAYEQLKKGPRQETVVELMRGVTIRLTKGDIGVGRVHYPADPDRDPEIHPSWKINERKAYTSQSSWDREQEIKDEAGGGELVFADTLQTYWHKIVIEDPSWRPDIDLKVEGGFDHGKTNPTALLRAYIDLDGTIIFAGEYYQPGLEIWQHARTIKQMYDFQRMEDIWADRSIFDARNQQQLQRPGHAQELARSLAELWEEAGVPNLNPFSGDRSDVSFVNRLLMHWADLDNRKPTVRIFCPRGMYAEQPVPGLYNWGCPNLLWELMNTRRVKFTAQQLMVRNVSEAIVDKDNHARDAMKYHLMMHPEPSVKPFDRRVAERLQKVDPTLAAIQMPRIIAEEQDEEEDLEPRYVGMNYRRRLQDEARRRRLREGRKW